MNDFLSPLTDPFPKELAFLYFEMVARSIRAYRIGVECSTTMIAQSLIKDLKDTRDLLKHHQEVISQVEASMTDHNQKMKCQVDDEEKNMAKFVGILEKRDVVSAAVKVVGETTYKSLPSSIPQYHVMKVKGEELILKRINGEWKVSCQNMSNTPYSVEIFTAVANELKLLTDSEACCLSNKDLTPVFDSVRKKRDSARCALSKFICP